MTIAGWVIFAIVVVMAAMVAFMLMEHGETKKNVVIVVCAVALVLAVFLGMRWYFTGTASGQRKLLDQRSNLSNGIERVVNVYTANGDLIAQYEGKIDLEADKSYVKFDFDGKRYIYYNCFVETIADIP